MGYYIETPGHTLGKGQIIVKEHGAVVIQRPASYSDIPEDMALICVVHNFLFEAVAYCYDEQEFNAFNDPSDSRLKTWLMMDKKKAEKLTGRAK